MQIKWNIHSRDNERILNEGQGGFPNEVERCDGSFVNSGTESEIEEKIN